ncbi:MAG: hypothetical protein ACKVP7_05685 [Hyphomicrobiaceae bacterium]
MRARVDPLAVILGLAALGLAALLWLAMTVPIERRPVADAGGDGATPVDAGLAARPARPGPLAGYSETLSRPLLEPTRRPVLAKPVEVVAPRVVAPPPVPPPAPAPPPSLAGLKLLGIVKAGREPLRALIRGNEGESGQWVVEGGQLGRWRVEKISEAAVVLEALGTRVELAMFAAPRPLAKR